MALRPRTQQVVGIIDELLQQSNRDASFTPSTSAPRLSTQRPDMGPQGSSSRTFDKALDMFNVAGSPTPLMPPSLRSQREPFRPPVNLGGTSAVAPGVPANASTGSLNVPQVGVRQQTPDEMALSMPRVPGSDMDIMAATQEAEAKMQDLGKKGLQAAMLEAKTPELKTDPTFQDRIKGFFGDRGNMLRLALAFNSLRTTPDQGLTAMLSNELKDLRTQNRGINVAARLRQIGTPEAIRAAEYIEGTGDVKGGMTMYNKAGSIVQKTGAELGGEEAGYDPKKIYNVDTISGKVSGVGGGGVNVNIEGEGQKGFYKEMAPVRRGFVDGAKQARKQYEAWARLQRAIDVTDTGQDAVTKQKIMTALDALGLGGMIDETQYANAQQLNAAANAMVAEELRSNKGPQTNFDAIFSTTYIGGLDKQEDVNREIVKYGKSTALLTATLGKLAGRIRPGDEDPYGALQKVEDYSIDAPIVVIRADGTAQYFEDFYNRNVGKQDLDVIMEVWIQYSNEERAAQAQQ